MLKDRLPCLEYWTNAADLTLLLDQLEHRDSLSSNSAVLLAETVVKVTTSDHCDDCHGMTREKLIRQLLGAHVFSFI